MDWMFIKERQHRNHGDSAAPRRIRRIRFTTVVSLINVLIHAMNAQRWRHSPGLTQVILEKTIIKLGSLLALGFGEASVFKAPRDVASLFSQFAPGWCEHH